MTGVDISAMSMADAQPHIDAALAIRRVRVGVVREALAGVLNEAFGGP